MKYFLYLTEAYWQFVQHKQQDLLSRPSKLNTIVSESNYYPSLPHLETAYPKIHWAKEHHLPGSSDINTSDLGPTIAHLAEKLRITPVAFFQRYIAPYEGLDLKTIQEILEIIGAWSPRITGQYLEFCVVPAKVAEPFLALEWLNVRIEMLGLPGLESRMLRGVLRPYQQCHYCGRYTDKTGKPFNNKKIYCHLPTCPKGKNRTSDPNLHKKGCCYAAWAHKRGMFTQKVDRLFVKHPLPQDAVTKIFIDFCEEELEQIPNIVQKPVRYPPQHVQQKTVAINIQIPVKPAT